MNKVKRNNYRFWHSPLALIILFLILVIFGYKIIDLIQKNKETARTKELILEKIDNLQKKESSLMSDIARLGTEEGKEEIIRGKYQVAKEGEKMLTIVDSNKNDTLIKEEKVSHGFVNWLKSVFDK